MYYINCFIVRENFDLEKKKIFFMLHNLTKNVYRFYMHIVLLSYKDENILCNGFCMDNSILYCIQ